MLNVDLSSARRIRRDVSACIRSGRYVSPSDLALYERVVRALEYLAYRGQRHTKVGGSMSDLPIAAVMWAADAADIERED